MGSHLLNWGQALEQEQDIWRKRTCQPKCGFLWRAYKSRWLKISLRLSTNTDQIYTNIWILNNIWIFEEEKTTFERRWLKISLSLSINPDPLIILSTAASLDTKEALMEVIFIIIVIFIYMFIIIVIFICMFIINVIVIVMFIAMFIIIIVITIICKWFFVNKVAALRWQIDPITLAVLPINVSFPCFAHFPSGRLQFRCIIA